MLFQVPCSFSESQHLILSSQDWRGEWQLNSGSFTLGSGHLFQLKWHKCTSLIRNSKSFSKIHSSNPLPLCPSMSFSHSGQYNGASLILHKGVVASPTWSLKLATDQSKEQALMTLQDLSGLYLKPPGDATWWACAFKNKPISEVTLQWINTIQCVRQDTGNIRKPMATDGYRFWDNGSSQVPLASETPSTAHASLFSTFISKEVEEA